MIRNSTKHPVLRVLEIMYFLFKDKYPLKLTERDIYAHFLKEHDMESVPVLLGLIRLIKLGVIFTPDNYESYGLSHEFFDSDFGIVSDSGSMTELRVVKTVKNGLVAEKRTHNHLLDGALYNSYDRKSDYRYPVRTDTGSSP